MKVGIIGAGAVGAACAMATIMRGCASELVLVNRGRDRAEGMATDMGYGAPLSSTTRVTDGDYADLAGASLVMVTVGINDARIVAKPGVMPMRIGAISGRSQQEGPSR